MAELLPPTMVPLTILDTVQKARLVEHLWTVVGSPEMRANLETRGHAHVIDSYRTYGHAELTVQSALRDHASKGEGAAFALGRPNEWVGLGRLRSVPLYRPRNAIGRLLPASLARRSRSLTYDFAIPEVTLPYAEAWMKPEGHHEAELSEVYRALGCIGGQGTWTLERPGSDISVAIRAAGFRKLESDRFDNGDYAKRPPVRDYYAKNKTDA